MEKLIKNKMALHQIEIRADRSEVLKLIHSDFLEVGKSVCTFDLDLLIESMGVEKPTGAVIHS